MDWLDIVAQVRQKQPLVHCISATVSMTIVANGLLAGGARPMMTETIDEAPAMDSIADALLINFGTLSKDGAQGIPATVEAANSRKIPWVLDPAAIGVAPVRTRLARQLIEKNPAVIRGNASEILTLSGAAGGGRGADSTVKPLQADQAAKNLALTSRAVVACSGEADRINDGQQIVEISGGNPLLARVTGTGCLVGALTAACCAVTDALSAAVAASHWMKAAGEIAAAANTRPGSFAVALLDALDEVGEKAIDRRKTVAAKPEARSENG